MSRSSPSGTTNYLVDDQGLVTGPGGHTGYSDDSLGRLEQVTDPANQRFSVGYDTAQRLGSVVQVEWGG